MKITSKLWVGIVILIILTPLGIFLPQHFKAGSAWGEWSSQEIQKMIGYTPPGLGKSTTQWNAPMPDYAFKGWENKGVSHLSIAYIVSALVGIAVIVLAVILLGKLLTRKGK